MQEKKQAKTKKILLQLAEYLKVKGIQGVASHLGENPNKLYAWVKNGNIGDTGAILGKHPEIRKEWLESGEGDMLVKEQSPAYSVKEVHRALRPDQEKLLHMAEEHDELVEIVFSLEDTPELELLFQDLKGKTREEIWEYVRAGRKALREGR